MRRLTCRLHDRHNRVFFFSQPAREKLSPSPPLPSLSSSNPSQAMRSLSPVQSARGSSPTCRSKGGIDNGAAKVTPARTLARGANWITSCRNGFKTGFPNCVAPHGGRVEGGRRHFVVFVNSKYFVLFIVFIFFLGHGGGERL